MDIEILDKFKKHMAVFPLNGFTRCWISLLDQINKLQDRLSAAEGAVKEYDASLVWANSTVESLIVERDQLRAQVEATNNQEPIGYTSSKALKAMKRGAGIYIYPELGRCTVPVYAEPMPTKSVEISGGGDREPDAWISKVAIEEYLKLTAECRISLHRQHGGQIPVYFGLQSSPNKADVPEELPVHVLDAVSESLGNAYDCMRTWSAWSYNTMRQNDFVLVGEDSERVEEIARAVLAAYFEPRPPLKDEPEQPAETKFVDLRQLDYGRRATDNKTCLGDPLPGFDEMG